MTVQTLADIAGDGAKHQLTTSLLTAKYVCFTATGGSTPPRVGDTNVSASRGVAVPIAGPPVELPMPTDTFDVYSLNAIFAFVPNGTTLSITYCA